MILMLAILFSVAVVALVWVGYPTLVALLGQGVAASPDVQIWFVLLVLFAVLAVAILITWMTARRRGELGDSRELPRR